MSTDNNDFDNWLKAKLYRDLTFRSSLWIGIAFATGYLAVFYRGVSAVEYLEKMTNTLGPLINTVGTFSLLLCVLALMLKDLEKTLGNPSWVAATRGHLGGLVRRLAGDLSLWTLGAFITLIATLVLILFKVEVSAKEYAIAGSLGIVLVAFTAFIATANVLVRRSGPTPLVSHIHKPLAIAAVYIAALTILTGHLLYTET